MMRQDLLELLCLVLSKAFKAHTDRSTLQHLAGHVKDSGFLRSALSIYLAGMVTESDPVRRDKYPQHIENILAVLSQVLSIFPASSVQTVTVILTLLQASINHLKTSGVDIQPHIEQDMETIQDLVKHLQERSRDGTLRSDKDKYALLIGSDNPDDEDVQDFRTISIYPTPEDFQQEQRPFLRPNLTSQRYTSTHLYLDTHFRLLREDFVRPLREGIQQLQQNQMEVGRGNNRQREKRFDDIRVYFDTQLVDAICTTTGLVYVAKFDIQPLQFVCWENSKRLLYGSLVCLSCDNFETFLFAAVSDRNPENLKKGLIHLAFTEESRQQLARIETGQLFLMVETTAFFEAYRYVLEGLQEQEEDKLPFQRYIVDCNTDVQPPAYLLEGDTYNLSSIVASGKTIKPFHTLKPEAWPLMEDLGFDESQMKAFQLALTKELAIIQGPPGTGKTYVGLKIAEALLTNQNLQGNRANSSPMLVVCYTNHALDQFLEGIHRFLQKGIVRVGSRSNSEILKKYNLRELLQSPNFRDSRPRHLSSAYGQIMDQLKGEEHEILRHRTELKCSQEGIIHENVLMKHMSLPHRKNVQTMVDFRHDPRQSIMSEWLCGLDFTAFQQRVTEDAKKTEATMEVTEEDDDLVKFSEMADLIEHERFIDDAFDKRITKAEQRQAENEMFVKKLKVRVLAINLDEAEIQAGQDDLVRQDNENFQIQRHQKRRMVKRIKDNFKETSVMTEQEEEAVNLWNLSMPDKWRLYRLWVTRYRTELRTKALESEQAYQNTVDRMAEIKRHESLCILKRATVIGMTTTGAAKYRKALQEVQPRLVIVEEAAEVLEAHTITTLSQACQHLILIGDHQQLRPSATVYDLAKNFDLEMSMFERLVKMNIPFVRLNFQHRMRPDIARLLTPHIYTELENHPSVLTYENIKGINTNLFFVEHNHLEEEIKEGKSHQNKHEALFVVALCRYFLLQDYKPQQITILTTYTGQLHCLRKLMPANQFTGVKVHVVDKYQGEENDIVLLSLVRSNEQGKVGFLKIANRVCVALSRAKKGLYCIGNSEMLGQVKLWSNIFHTLKEKGQIGKALTLSCYNHPDRQVKAASAEDFKQSPEGGCTQPCEFRLDCGHVCTRVCHPYDPEHKLYKCAKKCPKILCDDGHQCPLVCHKPCPENCPVKVEKIIPQCQHKQMVPCHKDPETFVCKEPCQKMLECGHPCDSFCGAQCSQRCLVKVTLNLKCGHSQEGPCFYQRSESDPPCQIACNHQLICGHMCQGTCHRCHQGRYHMPCHHQCKRLLICSHQCKENCTRNCPPCQMPCENRCFHSKCMKKCGYPCAPCMEPCEWSCPHQSCSKLCHEPCDRPPCTKPCREILKCGHSCIGLCGDKCPNKCRVCDHDEVTEIFFGTEDDPDAFFIQLEDCGHIFESTGMDKFMGIDITQEATEEEQLVIKLKQCPRCLTPIRKNLRYGSHINQSLAEIEMVKKKIHGDPKDIQENRRALERKWNHHRFIDRMDLAPGYLDIESMLEQKHLSANDLWLLENKMDFLIKLVKLEKMHEPKAVTHTLGLRKENFQSPIQTNIRLRRRAEEYEHWLNHHEQRFTDQQVFDLQRELIRLTLLIELDAHYNLAKSRGEGEKVESDTEAVRDTLEKSGQFTEKDESQVKDALKELNKRFPLTSLAITDEERKMIVSAMEMRPGHWYKCPNGHVYVITECGGAMEKRQCPDCDATIGGSNHALASDNQVATEMDGAQHAAWSEANNLINFDIDDNLHF